MQKKKEDYENIDERIASYKAKILDLKQQISDETKQNFNRNSFLAISFYIRLIINIYSQWK